MIKTVNCFYVDKPHGVGISESWQVVGTDGKSYLVKFYVYPDKTALNELLCNNIANFFELPIFEPILIELNQDHCNVINEKRNTNNLRQISPGKHFGVQLIQPFYTMANFTDTFGFSITKDHISNLHKIPDIFGFDTLIQNDDRHCDNVCIVKNELVRKKFNYYIFDHSHAFGGPTWFATLIKERYNKMQKIQQFCIRVDSIRRMDQFDRFFGFFEKLKSDMDSVFDSIPCEWIEKIQSDILELKQSLSDIPEPRLRDTINSSSHILTSID